MPTSRHRSFLADLPAELHIHILTELSISDLCRVRRLNRYWHSLMGNYQTTILQSIPDRERARLQQELLRRNLQMNFAGLGILEALKNYLTVYGLYHVDYKKFFQANDLRSLMESPEVEAEFLAREKQTSAFAEHYIRFHPRLKHADVKAYALCLLTCHWTETPLMKRKFGVKEKLEFRFGEWLRKKFRFTHDVEGEDFKSDWKRLLTSNILHCRRYPAAERSSRRNVHVVPWCISGVVLAPLKLPDAVVKTEDMFAVHARSQRHFDFVVEILRSPKLLTDRKGALPPFTQAALLERLTVA